MIGPLVERIFAEALQAAIPDADLTVYQWAEQHRYVSQGPDIGSKWRTDRVPYLKEILECATDPAVQEIVFWSSSRVGKTEGVLGNLIGYFMHVDPAPIMLVQPTLEAAEKYSRDRLTAMIRETPVLRDLVDDPRSRDSGNTLLHKIFLGGHISMVGANSPVGLASEDIRILLLDEVDRFPASAGAEGDPVALARVRTRNYRAAGNALVVMTSSPTIKGQSRIEKAFEDSDQRHLYVPCLACGEYQQLEWLTIKWTELDRAPGDAVWQCPGCQAIMTDDDKEEMLAAYEWRAHAEFRGRVGFKALGTYSPFMSWGEMARELTEAKRARSFPLFQVWANTTLGELWEEGEGLDEEQTSFHREDYPAPVPAGVDLITFGADTHPDRIEVEILGWGAGDESWSIDYRVFWGDPNQYPSPVWSEFEDYLLTDWQHELGLTMRASAGGIDAHGGCQNGVYKFCKVNQRRRWMAIQGASKPGRPLVPKKYSLVGPRTKLFTIGTEAAKDTAAAALRIELPPDHAGQPVPGFCHFPIHYTDDYFKQLTSEQRIRSVRLGFSVWRWVKKKAGARNEAWDCRVYAIFAKEFLRPNYAKLRERLLNAVADLAKQPPPGRTGGTSGASSAPAEESTAPESGRVTGQANAKKAFRLPRRRGGGFVGNW
jgi:phage terminase large subunit GpA-like protein